MVAALVTMTGPVTSGRAGGVSAIRASGAGKRGGPASSAMAAVASKVAANIADDLGLAVDPDGRRKGSANDPNGIEASADTLTEELGGTTADRGRAAQSLHGFAQEVASLVAARPGSRAVAQVGQAIAAAAQNDPSQSARDMSAALRLIDETTRKIAG